MNKLDTIFDRENCVRNSIISMFSSKRTFGIDTERKICFLSMTLEETQIKSFNFPRVFVHSLQIL